MAAVVMAAVVMAVVVMAVVVMAAVVMAAVVMAAVAEDRDMVERTTAYVSGFREMDKLLAQLPRRMQGNVLRNATMAGARVLRDAAKEAAPRGQDRSAASQKYGTLFSNIAAGRRRPDNKNREAVRVWTRDAFWGYFLEVGTSRMAARPWFRPAIDGAASEALATLRRSLAEQIQKQAEKLGRETGASRRR